MFWASGFGVAKIGLRYAEPLTFLSLRFGLIVALLVPVFLVLRPLVPSSRAGWGRLAIVGFLIQSVYFGLAYLGMSLGVSAGTAAVIASLQPLLVAIAAPLVSNERIGRGRWAGFALGAVGALLVVTAGEGFQASFDAGVWLCVGSAIGMAAATLYQKRFPVAAHPVTVNLVQYVVGFATVAPLALWLETGSIDWTAELAFALGWLIVANSIIAVSLLIFMVGRSEAARVSALFFLVPPVAALFGWLLLDEVIGVQSWFGIGMALVGVRLVSR
ncbi:peptide ABC transporter ATP-binding protein [Aureimonas endophytica]|uniref:Peptide ABC transporter ATP-binding protein n=1 Tax=Aureimonas endophytica TaxID=2027858 RepID=A0A916ZM84_9HYPH|nr:peptide ABC transporter ATP-binding protein [Aureimonas endophytica]